ncbi:hypothetical protein [Variovorax paradoxus]|uniref:Uncharacterized protein n=1 Tax=Variovorax paradoxus (strain EPS) TaxID=595537 RepID=E6V9B9_VARPE|nr:hypothetical protein [Variovorax paradoxus]ADU39603.1 hypothetical protein Varpa_5448 [Variovorax paradoxus EPS]
MRARIAFLFVSLLNLLSPLAHARTPVRWLGESLPTAADQRAIARIGKLPVLANLFGRCEYQTLVWKSTAQGGEPIYFIFCDQQAVAFNAQGESMIEQYIPLGRGCDPDSAACQWQIEALPSVRANASDLRIRSPQGCAELSWRIEGPRMWAAATDCREPVSALVSRKADCVSKAGSWEMRGLSKMAQCVTPTTDGDKICMGDWDCQNNCEKPPQALSSTPGRCAATTRSAGCYEKQPNVRICE